MMNRVLTSFNTFALILLFLFFVFSVFSIKTLKVNNTQSMKVNFFELSEITETQKRLPRAKPIGKIKEAGSIKTKEINQLEASLDVEKYKISKPDIKKELSKIKLSKERTEILKISSIIQDKISSVWIKPNSLSKILTAKVLINLAPSGEILNYELVEPSNDRIFDNSVLTAMNKISFLEEIIGIERGIFESNFRNFKLVFKSSGEIE